MKSIPDNILYIKIISKMITIISYAETEQAYKKVEHNIFLPVRTQMNRNGIVGYIEQSIYK